jgi:hypothetical protein
MWVYLLICKATSELNIIQSSLRSCEISLLFGLMGRVRVSRTEKPRNIRSEIHNLGVKILIISEFRKHLGKVLSLGFLCSFGNMGRGC